ncbi:MAG: hypothetical protein J07AB43_02690 [Candidatus Nanosalina sp. J07AB43]|jgi:hypothetical protein|nr:MAG: hypothetical protein J07AB43_02690 [Candidatus Nanosalina sp. J07AB43]
MKARTAEIADSVADSDGTGEEEVTEFIVSILGNTYGDEAIESGEIPVGEDRKRYLADVVVERHNIAIECKGKIQHLKGIGQAISYQKFGYDSYLVAYNMSNTVKQCIMDSPIGGVNLTYVGCVESITEDVDVKPRHEINMRLEYDDIESRVEFKQKYDILVNSIPDELLEEITGGHKKFDLTKIM